MANMLQLQQTIDRLLNSYLSLLFTNPSFIVQGVERYSVTDNDTFFKGLSLLIPDFCHMYLIHNTQVLAEHHAKGFSNLPDEELLVLLAYVSERIQFSEANPHYTEEQAAVPLPETKAADADGIISPHPLSPTAGAAPPTDAPDSSSAAADTEPAPPVSSAASGTAPPPSSEPITPRMAALQMLHTWSMKFYYHHQKKDSRTFVLPPLLFASPTPPFPLSRPPPLSRVSPAVSPINRA
jgi:hypothetical protein